MDRFSGLAGLISRHSTKTPDKAALISRGRTISWAELGELIDRTAAALQARGVTKGVLVGIYIRDAIAFVVVLIAIFRLRAVFVPLPTNLGPESLALIVSDCQPALIIVDANEIAAGLTTLNRRTPIVAYSTLISDGVPSTFQEDGSPEDLASVLYSSGTTGRPRGVVHTQGARFEAQSSFSERYSVTSHTRTLVATPLYTALTWASLLPTLAAGGTAVVLTAFDAKEFLELSKEHATTLTLLVPTQYAMLLEHEDAPKCFKRFDCLIVGGAKSDPALFERLMAASGEKLVEQLGSTETGPICTLPPGAPRAKWGSVGVPLSGVSIKILGEDDHELKAEEVGEIAVHSASLMVGYYGVGAKGALFWHDPNAARRYWRMGDLGSIDADGYLWVRGRSKELIISAGFNIYPADIEAVLLRHPCVRQAAVVGAPNQTLGEVPIAFVEAAVPGAVTEPELCTWLNARLNDKQRVYRVKIVEQLPVNASGKIVKTGLRNFLAASTSSQL